MRKVKEVPVKVEKVVEVVTEVEKKMVEEEAGLMTLLGEKVFLICLNYFYVGKLTGVNGTELELEDAGIVYATGEWTAKSWNTFEKLPTDKVYVKLEAVESYFKSNK